jgi:hypothetical protein
VGVGSRNWGFGFIVQGSGSRVQGVGRVWSLGRVDGRHRVLKGSRKG